MNLNKFKPYRFHTQTNFFAVLIFYCVSAFLTPAMSDPMAAKVTLDSIEAIKTTEKGGDEIYFDVTQYSNQGQSKVSRIPEAPEHWLSKQLSEVKAVTLWEGEIKDDEEVKVIISVLEQEFPPWDVDELVGSALITLENKKNRLSYRWELPIFEDKVEQEMANNVTGPGESLQYFIMQGNNSNYRVGLKVTSDKLQKTEDKV